MLLMDYLIEHDISVQYLTYRELLNNTPEARIRAIRRRLGMEGWGKRLLDEYDTQTGTWGGGWYGPKWVSTHYTLLSLKDLAIPGDNPIYLKASSDLMEHLWGSTGEKIGERAITGKDRYTKQDICICGMLLGIYSHSGRDAPSSRQIVDYLLDSRFADGGYNCDMYRGAEHSSVHSTLSVLEGFDAYRRLSTGYRTAELDNAIADGVEFLLRKQLFRSQRTGEIFDKRLTLLSFPNRWKYDILRALTFLARIGWPYDGRMDEALDIIISKQRKDGTWPNQGKHSGRVFFDLEKPGGPSGMNTFRALLVLRSYRPQLYSSVFREDYR
jgi:hypothetical protein